MIDERHEEAAALYVLDLLEDAELSAFEATLARDPELRRLVDQLRATTVALALSAPPAAPSPALRARILNSAVPPAEKTNGYLLPFQPPVWLGWAAAACFLFAAIFFAAKSFNVRGQLQAVLVSEQAARFEAASLRNAIEGEHLVSRKQLEDLAAANRQVATLRTQADIAQLKITTLASLAGKSPEARAIAIWNPTAQEGVLIATQLPKIRDDQDYQLWVIDPQYPIPVDGGVLKVDAQTGEARLNFKPGKTVAEAKMFAVSLERKGGVPKAEGPMVLISN